MTKSLVSSYRLLSVAAIAATSVLVACGPDDGDMIESAAVLCPPTHSVAHPAAGVPPAAPAAVPLT